MAKEKISELDAAAALDGTELVPVVQDGETVRTTTQDIADLGGASYLKYVALLSQTGTDAPVATVLENTLGGAVVWSYVATGDYTGTLAGAFTANKTWFSALAEWNTDVQSAAMQRLDNDSISLYAIDPAGAQADGFSNLAIEIRVYP